MIIAINGKIGSGKDTVGKIIQYLIWNKGKLTLDNIKAYDSSGQIKHNVKVYSGWEIKKFANILKDIVCLLIGCTREQLEDQEFKNKELEEEWWYWKLEREGGYSTILLPYYESTDTENFELVKLTPRLLLQLLGTECGRDIIHPNIWVNSLMSEYKSTAYRNSLNAGKYDNIYPNWIITDMRFPNELKAIKDKGGISIRVKRNNNPCVCIDDAKLDCLVKCDKKLQHESETSLDNATFDYTIDNNDTIEELIEKVKTILIKEHII